MTTRSDSSRLELTPSEIARRQLFRKSKVPRGKWLCSNVGKFGAWSLSSYFSQSAEEVWELVKTAGTGRAKIAFENERMFKAGGSMGYAASCRAKWIAFGKEEPSQNVFEMVFKNGFADDDVPAALDASSETREEDDVPALDASSETREEDDVPPNESGEESSLDADSDYFFGGDTDQEENDFNDHVEHADDNQVTDDEGGEESEPQVATLLCHVNLEMRTGREA